MTTLEPEIDPDSSEHAIRQGIGEVVPALKDVPGTWHQVLVSFSRESPIPWSAPFHRLPACSYYGLQRSFCLRSPRCRTLCKSCRGR